MEELIGQGVDAFESVRRRYFYVCWCVELYPDIEWDRASLLQSDRCGASMVRQVVFQRPERPARRGLRGPQLKLQLRELVARREVNIDVSLAPRPERIRAAVGPADN